MVKKTISVICVLILLGTLYVPAAHTAETSLTVSTVSANGGERVQLPVVLAGNTDGVAGLTFSFEYDSRLALKDIARGSDLPASLSFIPQNDYLKANPCKIVIDGLNGEVFNGEVAVLTFEVPQAASGSFEIGLSYKAGDVYDGDLQDINIAAVKGGVEVEPSKQQITGSHSSSRGNVTRPVEEKEDITASPTDDYMPEFADVTKNDWYYDSVNFVVKNNFMKGISQWQFSPEGTLSRAMLVTVLYRNENQPHIESITSFTDCTSDSYYYSAVIWAQQNGIVNGINENEFAPDENITREQIAAIMYRYARFKNYDVSVGENTNILSYDDASSVSEYATAALQYAVGSGLIKGKAQAALKPKDFATRAEMATILQRFINTNK